jgi:hypothetical protein
MQAGLNGVTPELSAWSRLGNKLDLHGKFPRRWIYFVTWLTVCAFCVARYFYLDANFPNYSQWAIDQAKFTDEGWWAGAAVMHALTGNWHVAGDYNPAVALPVWPTLLGILFRFSGVSVVAARALNVTLSIGTLAAVFTLVRRFTNAGTPAVVAVLLMAASPFAFVFSRLAILDTLVALEFSVLLLVASFASAKRIGVLAALSVLITVTLLTKTTAALLLPAVFWVAWSASGRSVGGLIRAVVAVGVLPAILVESYAAIVAALGYGADYRYFFGVNDMPDIDWRQTVSTLHDLFLNCFWVDRVLYPIALLILVLTLAWKRKLWSNALFTASWLALAAQAVFVFSRQDDYAPRYFLAMLAPMVWIIALTFGELVIHARKTAAVMLLGLVAGVVANGVMIEQFLTHRDYDLLTAANGIQQIVRSHPEQKPLLFGVSGSQISLMTGIPSINDSYTTEDMAEKLKSYQPGWYLVWDKIDPQNEWFLAPYKLEKMASYPAFDDDERTVLILYRMVRK